MRFPVPAIVLILALLLLIAAPFAFLAGRRGGRYRGMPGWVGFWTFFSGLLIMLSKARPWLWVPFLGAFMFVALKQYLFLAPIRPQDRYAILVSYLSIVGALYPVVIDDYRLFNAMTVAGLLFILAALLAIAPRQSGLLDSMGRVLLGALVFVYGASHLGLLAHQSRGRLELYGILVLIAELAQRVVGRPHPGVSVPRRAAGLALSFGLTIGAGTWLGTLAEITRGQGALAAALIVAAVSAGAIVADAVAEDLALPAASFRVGRGAFLDRAMPAIFPAAVYYHYMAFFL